MCHSSVCHSAEILSIKSHSVEYHSAECHSSKCRSAKCRSVRTILLYVTLPETFEFITNFGKLRTKKFYNVVPGSVFTAFNFLRNLQLGPISCSVFPSLVQCLWIGLVGGPIVKHLKVFIRVGTCLTHKN